MIRDQLDLFAGRQEAIHLFEKLYERRADEPWAFLPILSLVGPAGYGKSLFIHQLYFDYCNTPSLPHISLDFGRKDAPHDLLNILGTLRNSLGRQRDAHGQALEFPRFDIIYARLKRSEGQQDDEVDEFEELFGEFSDLIGLAGNIHVVLGLLLFILKFIFRIPPLHSLLRWLVERAHQSAARRPEWRWYQDQINRFKELNLPANASVDQILRRLSEMCVVGGPEREFLIQQILPKAFLADLRYGIYDNEVPMLRSGPCYVVIFLDTFEALLRNAEPTARQLLEALALNEYRKRGDSDPLLLIVGCEGRLPDMSRDQLNRHFPADSDVGKKSTQERAEALYQHWERQLPPPENRQNLKLGNLYLPLPLSPLTLDATRDYLLRLDQRNQTAIFANQALIEEIYRATQGYPIFLERMATALQAGIQNTASGIRGVESLLISDQGEQIVDRLLALHCKQVEERAFMLSAIPRVLTQEVLRLILEQLRPEPLNDHTLHNEWRDYRHRLFLLSNEDKQSITFVPGVRALFLCKLQIETAASDSDYVHVHQSLYNYFNQRIEECLRKNGTRSREDVLERSYHALALGDYESVMQLAVYARQKEPALWEDLLKVIAQAPSQKLPYTEVMQQAAEGLYQARRHVDAHEADKALLEAVRSIVLYTWLLADPGSESKHVSSLWFNLGKAYQCLQEVDLSIQRDVATSCFQHANELLDPPQPVVVPPVPSGTRPAGLTVLRPKHPSRVQQLVQDTYRAVISSRVLQILLSVVLLFTVLISLLVSRLVVVPSPPSPTPDPFALPAAELHPGSSNGWIGATVEPDKEFVGLSDGSVPFDYLRPDGTLKIRAATQLHQGKLTDAYATLQQAAQSDVNDAEALIYLQDVQIRLSGKPCTVFVVATRIIEDSSEGVNDGRDNLQGAYVAQKEYDTTHPDTPICLYIANLGVSSGYEANVAQQLVNATTAGHGTIKGLIGWPGLLDSPTSQSAVHLLGQAHLPIVSPDSYDQLQFIPNVFHVAPSRQDQGRRAALYAEQVLHKTQAAIITDPADPYSRGLADGFVQRFEEDGNQVVALQTYSSGHTDASTLAAELQSALAAHPDFIYFTGNVDDGNVLLAQLRADGSPVPLLGSEQLYAFVGFSADAQPGLNGLAFTSGAYADEPSALHMKGLYALDFDSQDPNHVRQYGYSRPDSETILSYDAMETLIIAYTSAAGLQSIQQALASVHIQGASRTLISFTHLQELADQSLLVLFIDQQDQIRFYPI